MNIPVEAYKVPTQTFLEVQPTFEQISEMEMFFQPVSIDTSLQVGSKDYWYRVNTIKNVFNNSGSQTIRSYSNKNVHDKLQSRWTNLQLKNLTTIELPVTLPNDIDPYNGILTVTVHQKGSVKITQNMPKGPYTQHFCNSIRFSSPEDFSKISKLELFVSNTLFDTINSWQIPILREVYGIKDPVVIPFGFCAPDQRIPLVSFHGVDVKIYFKDVSNVQSTNIIAEYGEVDFVSNRNTMLEYWTPMVTGTDVNPSVTFQDTGHLERRLDGHVFVTHLLINVGDIPLEDFYIHFQSNLEAEDQFSMKLKIDPSSLKRIGDFYVVPLCENQYDGISFSTATNSRVIINTKDGKGQSQIQIFTVTSNIVRCMNDMICLAFSW